MLETGLLKSPTSKVYLYLGWVVKYIQTKQSFHNSLAKTDHVLHPDLYADFNIFRQFVKKIEEGNSTIDCNPNNLSIPSLWKPVDYSVLDPWDVCLVSELSIMDYWCETLLDGSTVWLLDSPPTFYHTPNIWCWCESVSTPHSGWNAQTLDLTLSIPLIDVECCCETHY